MSRLRRIWKYSEGQRAALLALPLLILIQVIMEIWIPRIMGDMMDVGIYSGSMSVILRQGTLMIIASLGMTLSGLAISRAVSVWAAGLARNMRDDLFQRIQELAFSDLDEYGTASLLTRMSTDMNYVKKGAGMLSSLIHCPVMVAITIVVTVRSYPGISVVFLAGTGGLVVISVILIHFVIRHYRRMLSCYENLNELLVENITAQKTVKAFAREDYEKELFVKRAEHLRRESRIAESLTALNEPLMNLAINMCILGIVILSGRAIQGGSMQAGDFFCLISYANNILFQISVFALIAVPVINSMVSMDRVFEVTDKEVSIKDGEGSGHVPDGSVCFDHVGFGYHKGSDEVLKDISLNIKSGEFIGIIGSSGSGKTTLVNLIPRFYDVGCGTLTVGGTDVRRYKLDELRGMIGLVPQTSLLFSGTIAENLRWGNEDADMEDMVKAASMAGANDFIMHKDGGYGTMLSQGGSSLSGGQRQRLCIARALVRKPKILIMDDSLSAVDRTTEEEILDSLRNRLEDTTVILVSQRFSSVQNADRIVVLDRGRIDAVGTHDHLLEESRVYRELYETQRRMME